ncbi:hypothetical protein SMACR_12683 [Sordaria macrospora]|uniref:WGS project CABT00000000 data, contig 2.1583 n=2 Tax=Sordaria macrospora TaxID=5147 RepID=F7WD52_SORMK|nr:uncharacterized protein SMAC_12683 [Sordaria macrospora k-hell]KAA8624240.1 hypothetical protein SMACR_12683 [Sordaria macrospora]CCC14799.1 unnamed protein product [Sordaria macrospora k-hell]
MKSLPPPSGGGILENLKTVVECNTYNNDLFAELMNLYSNFSPEEIAAILPYIVVIFSNSLVATAALVVVLIEIHRRGSIVDGTISVDGQPLNRELARSMDTFNDTVSTATDFVDRTTTLIEGQGG